MRFAAALVAAVLPLVGAPVFSDDAARGIRLPGGLTVGDDLVGMRTALCIGINGYRHDRYGPLRSAAADAHALAKVLQANGYAVTVMADDDPSAPADRMPTYRNLDDTIHRVCRASRSRNDTLLICFSGHGDVVDGQSALIPLDYHDEERVVTVGALFDALGRARAGKKLLVIDACRSGTRDAARLLRAGFLGALGASGDAVVISGCAADQFSYEDEGLGLGRLTRTLVDGLSGGAFVDKQEFLYGYDLWGYVARRFEENGWMPTQSPTMFGTWDARVRFDLARRDVAAPPPLTQSDRAMYDLALRTALSKFEADDLTSCVESCGTALRILENDADALALRAFAYAMLGFYDRANRDVELVLAKDPDNVYALVIRRFASDGLVDPGAFNRDGTRALLRFQADPERWVRRLPPKLSAYLWLAHAIALSIVARPAEEQRIAYDRVVSMSGASPKAAGWAFLLRGDLAAGQRRFEDGILDYSHAIERAPGESEVLVNARARRGRAHVWLGRYDDAARDLDWAIEHGADQPSAQGMAWDVKATIALLRADFDAALAAYDRIDALAGTVPREFLVTTAFGRGRIHRDRGQYEQAIAQFTRALESGARIDPESRAWLLAERGAAQAMLCEYDAGLKDLGESLAVAGTFPQVRAVAGNWKGTTLQKLRRVEDAAAAFRTVSEIDGATGPERAFALARLALCHAATGAVEDARARVEDAIARADISPEARVLCEIVRSRLLAAGRQTKAAIEAIDRASAVASASPAFRRLVEMERAALVPAQAPPSAEGEHADWSRALFHLARREWDACERACAAALGRGYAPADVYAAVAERWHYPGEPPETEVVFAWMRTGWTQDKDVRRVLRRYLADHPDGPLASRAKAILEQMK